MIRSLSRWKLIQSSLWKKLFFSENEHNKKELHDEKMLMKIRAARYENDFFICKVLWKSSLKQFVRILKNWKQKKVILFAIKNIRIENYSNAVNLTNKAVFSKNSKFIDVLCADVAMKEIFVDINLNLQIVKYKKIKLIKFSSVEVVEIMKRLKKLTQIIKKQSDSIDVIKQILNTSIEIRLRELLDISFELFRQMFRSIIDEKIKTISKERRIIAQSKDIKEKKVHVDSMRFSSTKSMHLREIVTRVAFLRLMYVVACSIVSVMIKNIKIKAMFNNEAEVNCMFKRLIDATQLSVRQSINIIMINVTDERARFFNVCEIVFISIDSITISVSVFVVKRPDHELLLERPFQYAARMSFINMNDESLEMILHSLNKKKRVSFLKVSAEHVSNKEKKSMFAMKFLNV